ncbi:hypothetical protein PR048_002411 [Dryococelus australis]|uniref:Uncharacterized protein n=1 Tax=Dryococelus australis TaxID=614101 RepID=A0ABQ9IK31_9NEOP|nr:hypothetical protein PR048_002411 [Dryococelus australis]
MPVGAAADEWIDCSPPTMANQVQSPAWSLPDFRKWESCRAIGQVGIWSAGFLGDLPFPQPLYSGAAPFSPRFTLVGCQDLVGHGTRATCVLSSRSVPVSSLVIVAHCTHRRLLRRSLSSNCDRSHALGAVAFSTAVAASADPHMPTEAVLYETALLNISVYLRNVLRKCIARSANAVDELRRVMDCINNFDIVSTVVRGGDPQPLLWEQLQLTQDQANTKVNSSRTLDLEREESTEYVAQPPRRKRPLLAAAASHNRYLLRQHRTTASPHIENNSWCVTFCYADDGLILISRNTRRQLEENTEVIMEKIWT